VEDIEKVLEVGAARCWLYLAAKALGVGPARYCLVLSPQRMVVPYLRDVKPPGLDICGDVDYPGTYSPGTRSPRAQLLGGREFLEPGYEVGR
jgi:hypothetical protein